MRWVSWKHATRAFWFDPWSSSSGQGCRAAAAETRVARFDATTTHHTLRNGMNGEHK